VKIYIPAWHYRVRAIIQRVWGWSPVEEMILLVLDRTPGTIEQTAKSLSIPKQVSSAAIARLMQFGLIEVRPSPTPVLATSKSGRELVRAGDPLPERTEDREIHVSLVFEKVGQSVLRKKNVDLVPLTKPTSQDMVVTFPPDDPPETDETMAERVAQLTASMLRRGEWFRGAKPVTSAIDRKYLALEYGDVKKNVFPEGASAELVRALNAAVKTGIPPKVAKPKPTRPPSIHTTLAPEQIIVGGDAHLELFERIVGAAKSDVFVLSTFVVDRRKEVGKERKERIWAALRKAVASHVRCHLFFGTSTDVSDHAVAMQELEERLGGATRGFVIVHRDTVHSHAKILAADDGRGGAAVVLGSCNWFTSPIMSIEASLELRERNAAAMGLDLLSSLVASISTSRRSREILQFMATDLRRSRNPLLRDDQRSIGKPVEMSVVFADDHGPLLRRAAHTASQRFVCATNTLGALMLPGLFTPAQMAAQSAHDVRVYYSRRKDPVAKSDLKSLNERLEGLVALRRVRDPMVHAKFLAWDNDDVVITSFNWGSQSGTVDNRLDEIGLHVKGVGTASALLTAFDSHLKR
jgi:hypothetical protein